MSERICYRYRTAALCGPWRRQSEAACRDARAAWQVYSGAGDLAWRVSGEIEASLCDQGGPCGGDYPPE